MPPTSHALTRREWLRLTTVGTMAALVPTAWPRLQAADSGRGAGCVADNDFARPLFVAGDDGPFGRLMMGTDVVPLAARSSADALAFSSAAVARTWVNPTLVAASGARVQVQFVNALAEPTVVHWHGLTMDTRNDGNGETLVAPGGRFDYAFTVRNRGGLYWYHPHPHGATARQVYRGLFGLVEVDDDDERALRRALDLSPGATELTLVLQDRRAGDGDRYAPAPEDELYGWYGCLPHVNGVLRPFHGVAGRRYRLRLLNASNARTYRLALRRDDGAPLPFTLLGTDGGLLEQGVTCTQILLSPGERIDVLADFAAMPVGGFVVLETRAFDSMQSVTAATPARSGATDGHAHSGPRTTDSLPDGAPFDLMQFRITARGNAGPALPARLSRLPAMTTDDIEARPLRLGFAKGQWRINDRVYDPSVEPIVVPRGARETWLLRNYHASAPHAMHLHGFQFRVLERETSPNFLAALTVDGRGRLPTDLGLKDTVLVWPGESVRIGIDFRHPFADSQLYLLHCHNLEHEDAGMMLRVRVG